MSTTVYIGMDVHSTNYTLSSYIFEEDKHFATVKLSPETNSILNYIKRIRKEYGDDIDVITGYEAGCLGYTLYKDLKKNDVECIIVAPTSLPKQKTGEIKTDKRDARKIAQALAAGNYKKVYVPDDHDDQIKQYIRMRDDHKLALKKVKQQILSFCLRNGFKYSEGRSHWTKKHLKWLRDLEMSELLKTILEEYLISYDYYSLRMEQMDKRIEANDLVKKLSDAKAKASQSTDDSQVYIIWSASKILIDKQWCMPLSEVTFEGMNVTTFNKPEAYLVRHYGESFKTLPPEEKRRVGINRVQIL